MEYPFNIPDKLTKKLRTIESKTTTLLDEPQPNLDLLRALVEKGEYRALYLTPKPEQFDQKMINEKAVMASGVITVTAIYLGDSPSLLIDIDKLTIVKAPLQKPKKRVILSDSENED